MEKEKKERIEKKSRVLLLVSDVNFWFVISTNDDTLGKRNQDSDMTDLGDSDFLFGAYLMKFQTWDAKIAKDLMIISSKES